MKGFKGLKVWEKSHLLTLADHACFFDIAVTEVKRIPAGLLKNLKAES